MRKRPVLLLTVILIVSALLFNKTQPTSAVQGQLNIQTVDTRAAYGVTDLVLDSENNPHIIYHAYLTFNKRYGDSYLMYGAWNGSAWNIQTLDIEVIGRSLALDSHNFPHISYITDTSLVYASWNGYEWNKQTVVEARATQTDISLLALDSQNQPHLCYVQNGTLKYMTLMGSVWTEQIVDQPDAASPYGSGWATDLGVSSFILDTKDNPHITYTSPHPYAYSPDDGRPSAEVEFTLRYATLKNSKWNIQTLTTSASRRTDIAIDTNDYPHIIYANKTIENYQFHQSHDSFTAKDSLVYKRWNGNFWDMQIVDSSQSSGIFEPTLVLDSKNGPHIVYYRRNLPNENGGLFYATWNGLNWNLRNIDSDLGDTRLGSLIIDSKNVLHLSCSILHPGASYNLYGNSTYIEFEAEPTEPFSVVPVTDAVAVFVVAVVAAVAAAVACAGLLLYLRKRKH